MRVLFIGDIIGAPGRKIIERSLRRLQDELEIDFTVANGENSAGGAGINKKVFTGLVEMGVDALTMGNHIWDNKDIFNFIDDPRIVRPANLSPRLPGAPWRLFEAAGQKIALANVIGRTYMPPANCPFTAMDQIHSQTKDLTPILIVDFHAEATSEKAAMAWYLDGRASAVIGTHTHVQSNDARFLNRGTVFINDVGMTGPRDSILGVGKEEVIERFLTQVPVRFSPATGDIQFNGVVLNFDTAGKVTDFEVLNFYEPEH